MSWGIRISLLAGILLLVAYHSNAQNPVQVIPPNQDQTCNGSLLCASMYVLNGCYFTGGRVPMCVDSVFNPAGCDPSLVTGYLCVGDDDFGNECSISFDGCQ